jgi:predicted secreted protein
MAFRAFLSSLLLVSALAACSSAQASELGATCEQFQKTPTVQQSAEVGVGRDLTIVLCSNATTGYSWGEAVVADPSIASVVSQSYAEPAASSLPVVGQAGGEVVQLRAVTPGTTTMTLSYGQPWAGGAKSAWSYELTLTVR